MIRIIATILAFMTALAGDGCSPPKQPPTVILISSDGFRWDYQDQASTPTLDRLAAGGVKAQALIPVFPSKTFPSHYSLATGLHPGHHGIVSNNILDPESGKVFTLSDREQVENPDWWGGEPIWVTAERQGVTAATLFWPGSEAPIAGIQATHWRRYDRAITFEERVGQVLAWLDLAGEDRPHFITLYIDEPNDSGHRYGPSAPETRAAVEEVDRILGLLVEGLEQRDLLEDTHLILVSDHGMEAVARERTIILDDYVELKEGELFEQGALLQIFPEESRTEIILEALVGAHPELSVYRREEIPERFHLAGNPRVAPIIGVPEPGWEVMSQQALDGIEEWTLHGDHGQDPRAPSMHGIFIATGPALAKGLEVEAFQSIHVYNLLATLLELEPAPNDGDPAVIAPLLVQ